MKRFSSVGAAAYRSCSTFLSRAYSRSVTSIFWYRSCRACRDVHTSAAPSLESDPDRQTDSDQLMYADRINTVHTTEALLRTERWHQTSDQTRHVDFIFDHKD